MRPAVRLLTGVLGVFALTFLSPPGGAIARGSITRLSRVSTEGRAGRLAAQAAPPDDRMVDRFVLVAINTQEQAEITMVGPDAVPDAASLAAARHILRSYGTNREGPLDARLLQVLHAIAKETGKPVQVVSGYRPPSHRHDRNYHVRGMAADVRVAGVGTYRLVKLARKLGARGIGYYPTSQFVHVDVRDDAPFQWTDRSGPSALRR
jgi:uncharacterized protein YcbK (DUF882 family)